MADPFQNVDAAGAEFITTFAETMETRQNDPSMEAIVADYLDRLSPADDARIIEIGAGAGAVTRRIAKRLAPRRVTGFEPSEGFVAEARHRARGFENLDFEVADGADLPLDTGSVGIAVLHTVLTHVTDPAALIEEAARVLTPDGTLVICDADFSKASLGSFAADPLDCSARLFVGNFVTDPYLVGRLRMLVTDAGLTIEHFDIHNRVITDTASLRVWVSETAKVMQDRGEIGEVLAEALVAEHDRRVEKRSLYGFLPFATCIARKG